MPDGWLTGRLSCSAASSRALLAASPPDRQPVARGRHIMHPHDRRALRYRGHRGHHTAHQPILRLAASLRDVPADVLPGLVRERLTEAEQALLDQASGADAPAAGVDACVTAIRRLRVQRDLAAVQEQVDQLDPASPTYDGQLTALWDRKKELLRQFESLT